MNRMADVVTVSRPPGENSIRFDTLNGEDVVHSTWQITKVATILGGAAGVTHLALFFPKTSAEGALRAANITGTFALLGAVFATATNASASVREKDDAINYMAGGCASGVLLGAKVRSFGVGTGYCFGFGLTAGFYKYWMESGYGKFLKPPTY